MADEEKQGLLSAGPEKPINSPDAAGSYGGVAGTRGDEDGEGVTYTRSRLAQIVYDHREKIPGYGVLRMLKQGSVYSLYVLMALLMVYLLNQLDRYTLPIVTTSMGPDLRYGDKTCQINPHVNSTMLVESGYYKNFTKNCASKSFQNHTACVEDSYLEEFNISACRWWWSGEGFVYQVVAGPVFNNLYPLAGVFTAFLADFGNRKVFLVISLIFWSLATGLTGFAQTFWHLVVLRALLAIGAAGCNPFAISIIGDYFPKELRGSAIGIYYFGIYIGYSLAFAIGNGIDQVLGWRWVFFLSGIVGIVVAPIVLFTVREPERTNTKKKTDDASAADEKLPLGRRFYLLFTTFIMPGMFVLCLAGGIRNAGGYVWAYNTEIFFQEFYSRGTINKFMSWIPLVGGSLGAVVGGLISDLLVKNRGTTARIWVLVVSQVAAAPFAAGALFLPYPWCFLSLIPSNVIGEMWIGVTSAIIVDMAPVKIRTATLGIYFFIITVIGGNFNLLVEPIKQGFGEHFGPITSLRLALLFTFPALYVIGSALFLLSYYLMKLDVKLKGMVKHQYPLNGISGEGRGEEGRGGEGAEEKEKLT